MSLCPSLTLRLGQRQLKPRTRAHYRNLLDKHILPTFARTPLRSISPTMVRGWYASLSPDTPTLRAHAYGLVRAILHTAVYDGEISANPAHIRGAGTTTRAVAITPATLDELTTLVAAMPPRRQAMILLAGWCGLRFGEITELRRKDLDLHRGTVHVHRAVTRVDGHYVITTPKSAAGRRDVALPPHLIPALQHHLDQHTAPDPEALVFPASGDPTRHLAPASLYKTFYRARNEAGRPDLRWHDLRHTGAVLAAHTGATLAELMNRLGHSTPQAALRYQHATNDPRHPNRRRPQPTRQRQQSAGSRTVGGALRHQRPPRRGLARGLKVPHFGAHCGLTVTAQKGRGPRCTPPRRGVVPVVVHFGPIRRMSCLWPSLSGPWRSPMRSCVPDATRVYPGGEKSDPTGHGDGVALLGGDVVVVGVLRVVAEVDPHPAGLARRKTLSVVWSSVMGSRRRCTRRSSQPRRRSSVGWPRLDPCRLAVRRCRDRPCRPWRGRRRSNTP